MQDDGKQAVEQTEKAGEQAGKSEGQGKKVDDRVYEFKKLQFESLRKEISESKSHLFKLIGIGPLILPLTGVLKNYPDLLSGLVYCLPFAFIIMSLLYLAEFQTMMRCGMYIREEIEPSFTDEDNLGWEQWLEENASEIRTRMADKIVFICYHFFCIGSYLVTSHSAVMHLDPGRTRILVIAGYSVVALILLWIIIKTKFSTNILKYKRANRNFGGGNSLPFSEHNPV